MVKFALIQPIMCEIIVWSSAYNNVLELLNITQKMLIKVVIMENYYDHHNHAAHILVCILNFKQ